MILLDVASTLSTWVTHSAVMADSGHHLFAQLSFDGWFDGWDNWSVLAQQLDTDPFRGFRTMFSNFFKSGQAWAFLAGVVFGYLIRSLTSYG